MIVDEIWAVWTEDDPDFNLSDSAMEARRVYNCQSACHEWLYNGMPEDEYLDHLATNGVDIDNYIVTVQRNTEIVIANEIPLEDVEFLIL